MPGRHREEASDWSFVREAIPVSRSWASVFCSCPRTTPWCPHSVQAVSASSQHLLYRHKPIICIREHRIRGRSAFASLRIDRNTRQSAEFYVTYKVQKSKVTPHRHNLFYVTTKLQNVRKINARKVCKVNQSSGDALNGDRPPHQLSVATVAFHALCCSVRGSSVM